MQSSLNDELANFERILKVIKPSAGALPKIPGIEIAGVSLPLSGEVGGDHTIYIDFNQRYDLDGRIKKMVAAGRPEAAAELQRLKHRAGVLLADVSGHRVTDAVVTAMLHQAFLLGALYELDIHGQVTPTLFEHLNQRFHKTTHINKYITMVYGEISSSGRFRFILAGHPRPLIFSRAFGRLFEIGHEQIAAFPPLGIFPSGPDFSEKTEESSLGVKDNYEINTIDLMGNGDILILYTDGLAEADSQYFTQGLVASLREVCDRSAAQIGARIRQDLLAIDSLDDDASFVVIKKSRHRGQV